MKPTALVTLLASWVASVTSVASGSMVNITLTSPQQGAVLPPGAAVDWSIWVAVSPDDNEGLAFIVVDLVQDAANNPATFDIAPGLESSIVPPMDQFSRPKGFSNSGEGGASTGYIGWQRGTPGAMNLVQIGGAQNTFGQAGPAGINQDIYVEGGIGQSGPVLVLSGQLQLPADPLAAGAYTFSLANGFANTLDQVNEPPLSSPVSSAMVDLSSGVLTVTMLPEPAAGVLLVVALAAAVATFPRRARRA